MIRRLIYGVEHIIAFKGQEELGMRNSGGAFMEGVEAAQSRRLLPDFGARLQERERCLILY